MALTKLGKLRIPAMFVCALVLSAPAHALDDNAVEAAIGGALGGALGAVIGNEIGGESAAILGSVIGAASGTAIIMDDSERDRHVHDGHWDRGWHGRRWHRGWGEEDRDEWEEDD